MTEAELCAEFKAWCQRENLPWLSADELILEDITDAQRRYISKFILRWEDMLVDQEARYAVEAA
jgi:hypothetical protein